MTAGVRPELPPMPPRIAELPLARGYPVPWFVAWIDGEPDFRVIGPGKVRDAARFRWCWICGKPLGSRFAYLVGPMCAVNRTSAEPPSHRDCAVFSAIACPFMTKPQMRRREGNLPEDAVEPGGIMLRRNPGVALVWISHGPIRRKAEDLFDLGYPDETIWYTEGRSAHRSEIVASIESGLPALVELAEAQGGRAPRELSRLVDNAMRLIPSGRR